MNGILLAQAGEHGVWITAVGRVEEAERFGLHGHLSPQPAGCDRPRYTRDRVSGSDSTFEALLGELAHAPERPVAGTRVGRYTIVAPIGKGGMGEVYRARDEVVGRDVAVKLLFSTDSTVDRFRREVVALGSVSHENIVAVYDAGTEGGRPYVVLELVNGESLR